MLKTQLTRDKMLALAADFGFAEYSAIDNLIEELQIGRNKEIILDVVTTDKKTTEYMLQSLFGLESQLNIDGTLKLKASYGDSAYSILSEYGELSIDKNLLQKSISSCKNYIECAIQVQNTLLKNIVINVIYCSDYNNIDVDNWRLMLLEADKVIVITDASHVLYASEQEFVNTQVLPIFSSARFHIGVGNAQDIISSEWQDIISRISLKVKGDYTWFPIFTDDISPQRRCRYLGSEMTLETILQDTQNSIIELRKKHFDDIDAYKNSEFERALIELKMELEQKSSSGATGIDTCKIERKIVTDSRKHLENNINLFLETPFIAHYRTALEQFADIFKDSLREDILASTQIKQDARELPRYLSAVWEQFSEDWNQELYKEFEQESVSLIDMMNIDLRHISRSLVNINLKGDIKDKLNTPFNVHTFFARKTNGGNDATEALTIGGLLAMLVSPMGGAAAVVTSELIKVFGAKSIENEQKKILAEKIPDVIESNKTELLQQAENNCKAITQYFREAILGYYDEVMDSINNAIKTEEQRLSVSAAKIETINELI